MFINVLLDSDLKIGCGSGAISLSLLHELPHLHATALDINESAVNLTALNARRCLTPILTYILLRHYSNQIAYAVSYIRAVRKQCVFMMLTMSQFNGH